MRDYRRSKLDPRFEGPFKVIGKSKGSYILKDNSGALLPRNYPPSAIKVISSDPVFDSPSFEVEAILDHRIIGNDYEYLVRWKRYTGSDATDPATHLPLRGELCGAQGPPHVFHHALINYLLSHLAIFGSISSYLTSG